MKNASHYQAFTNSPSYSVLKQLAEELREKTARQLKSEKTAFKTAKNLIRCEAVDEFIVDFFSTLEKRANGER